MADTRINNHTRVETQIAEDAEETKNNVKSKEGSEPIATRTHAKDEDQFEEKQRTRRVDYRVPEGVRERLAGERPNYMQRLGQLAQDFNNHELGDLYHLAKNDGVLRNPTAASDIFDRYSTRTLETDGLTAFEKQERLQLLTQRMAWAVEKNDPSGNYNRADNRKSEKFTRSRETMEIVKAIREKNKLTDLPPNQITEEDLPYLRDPHNYVEVLRDMRENDLSLIAAWQNGTHPEFLTAPGGTPGDYTLENGRYEVKNYENSPFKFVHDTQTNNLAIVMPDGNLYFPAGEETGRLFKSSTYVKNGRVSPIPQDDVFTSEQEMFLKSVGRNDFLEGAQFNGGDRYLQSAALFYQNLALLSAAGRAGVRQLRTTPTPTPTPNSVGERGFNPQQGGIEQRPVNPTK